MPRSLWVSIFLLCFLFIPHSLTQDEPAYFTLCLHTPLYDAPTTDATIVAVTFSHDRILRQSIRQDAEGTEWWEVLRYHEDTTLATHGWVESHRVLNCDVKDDASADRIFLNGDRILPALQDGDILVFKYDDCALSDWFCWGYPLTGGTWMHSAMVVNRADQLGIIQSTTRSGVAFIPYEDLHPYHRDDIVVLRVDAAQEARSSAVDVALSHIGKPFTWSVLNRENTEAFYCSQLIWQSYQSSGQDLNTFIYPARMYWTALLPDHDLTQEVLIRLDYAFVTPDDLYHHPSTSIIDWDTIRFDMIREESS